MHFTSSDIRDVNEAPLGRRDKDDIVRQPAREDVVLLRRASLDGKRPTLIDAPRCPFRRNGEYAAGWVPRQRRERTAAATATA